MAEGAHELLLLKVFFDSAQKALVQANLKTQQNHQGVEVLCFAGQRDP